MTSRLTHACLAILLTAVLPACQTRPPAVMSVGSKASLSVAVRLSQAPYRTQFMSQLDWDTAQLTLTPGAGDPLEVSAAATFDSATGVRSATLRCSELSATTRYQVRVQLLRKDRAGTDQVVAESVQEGFRPTYGANALTLVATPTAAAGAVISPAQPALLGTMMLTVAGSPSVSYPETPALQGQLNAPYEVAVAADGTIYVADTFNNLIRKIAPDGQMSTLAGTGKAGYKDGDADQAEFSRPNGIAVLDDGSVYVADGGSHTIRRISPNGQVSTFAGNGTSGFASGQGAAARFNLPMGMCTGPDGNLYVADCRNNAIRRITPDGTVTTVAGNGTAGANASASANCLNFPMDVDVAADGTLYVCDYYNLRVVYIRNGTVTLIKNNLYPSGVAVTDSGEVFYTDNARDVIWRYAGGTNTTIAGVNGQSNWVDGVGTAARFSTSYHMTYANGALFFPDLDTNHARKISIDTKGTPSVADDVYTTSTIAGNGQARYADGSRTAALLNSPIGLDFDPSGNLLVVDTYNQCLRKVTLDGQVTTLAGNGQTGLVNGPLASAKFNWPVDVVVDQARNKAYVSDQSNNMIRVFNADGTGNVSTFAGTGTSGFNAGTVAAASAQFNDPQGLALGPDGSLYVADLSNYCVRKIRDAGGGNYQVSVLAGNGTSGYVDGSGAAARFGYIYDVAVAPDNTVYVVDGDNNAIRKIVDNAGVVTVSTLAGGSGTGFADGTGASAKFNYPGSIAVEPDGNLLVGDGGNSAIRRVTPAGVVTTLMGTGQGDYADGALGSAKISLAGGIAIKPNGEIYFTDSRNHSIRKIIP